MCGAEVEIDYLLAGLQNRVEERERHALIAFGTENAQERSVGEKVQVAASGSCFFCFHAY